MRLRFVLAIPALAACSDGAGPSPLGNTPSGAVCGKTDTVFSALALSGLPSADTIRQAGLEFSFSRAASDTLSEIRVDVDGGAQSFAMDSAWLAEAPDITPVVIPAPAFTNGPHTFAVRVVRQCRVSTATFQRVVDIPSVPYMAEFLGNAGYYESRGSAINTAGDVAGSLYSSATEIARPFVWSGGTLTPLALPAGAARASAAGLNDVGDVVGSADFPGGSPSLQAMLWRNDSVTPLFVADTPVYVGALVNNNRRLLAAVKGNPNITRLYDLATGNAKELGTFMHFLNNADQAIGEGIGGLYSQGISASGLTIGFPLSRPGHHERYFRGERYYARGLDDSGVALATHQSTWSSPFLSMPGPSLYIEQYVGLDGRASLRMSPSGEVLSFFSTDSIFIWNRVSGARRLVLSVPGLSVTSVVALNAAGHVLAYGSNSGTGESGALVLKPQ